MKKNIILFFLFFSFSSFSQNISSGLYEDGLRLAIDTISKKITGYYASYSGLDFETNKPKFSCIFYLEGKMIDSICQVETYFPSDKSRDFIQGKIQLLNNNKITLQLKNNHGGCLNIQNLVDEPVEFELEIQNKWTSVRYVVVDKTYFYSEKSIQKIKKSYLIKNNFVCIDKIENEWAFCTFYGEKITSGWILSKDLNSI